MTKTTAKRGRKTTAKKTTARKSTARKQTTRVTVKRKKCPRCGKTRAASAFWKNRTTADGLQVYCKGCYHVGYNKGGKSAARKARMI